MPDVPYRYVSDEEDSGRWLEFPFRTGDIVISTRSKSGTTWMQMICALLVFGSPELPRPLGEISPWLDHLVTPLEAVVAQLAAQPHRRVIKSHTPLDGIPLDPRASYIVVARNPLDSAVSMYHQGANIDRQRLRELIGEPPTPESDSEPERPALHEWLLDWIASDADPREAMDSLPGVMWHLSDAWRRRDQPNVVLLHYSDLLADLAGQMRQLAARLAITIPAETWPAIVSAASFTQMKRNAEQLIPDRSGILKDPQAFFRRGGSGAGSELLTEEEAAAYHARVADLAPPELLAWLHR